jgi:hypothetical protein
MKPKSEDLMDRGRRVKQAFSKKEKREYARAMHMEALCQPPKDPSKIPEFLSEPTLLPKRPPPTRPRDDG